MRRARSTHVVRICEHACLCEYRLDFSSALYVKEEEIRMIQYNIENEKNNFMAQISVFHFWDPKLAQLNAKGRSYRRVSPLIFFFATLEGKRLISNQRNP